MRDDTLWQAVLGEIELTVRVGKLRTWFKNTQVLPQRRAELSLAFLTFLPKQTARI